MKAAIIDDERLARLELRSLLEDLPDAHIVGEAGHAQAALQLVAETQPDVLFLDIEMPGQSGFDFLNLLPTPHPRIVFVTAYDAFAVRAFERNAVDYLLKPVLPKRLAETWRRLQEGEPPPQNEPATQPLLEEDHVYIRDEDRCWFVPVKRIRLLEGSGNHTRVHFDDQSPLLYRTLVSMEARLPEALFLRANRSQLLNRHYIQKLDPWFSGTVKATLADGAQVEFSRRQSQLLRSRLSL